MDRHVRLLVILTVLWGALATLVGIAMLLLAAGAYALSAGPQSETVALAASLATVIYVSIGVFLLAWGVAHTWAAVLLRQRAPSGRLLTLGLGVVNLLVFPFGTALGGYALWILLTHDGRRLFEVTGQRAAEAGIK